MKWKSEQRTGIPTHRPGAPDGILTEYENKDGKAVYGFRKYQMGQYPWLSEESRGSTPEEAIRGTSSDVHPVGPAETVMGQQMHPARPMRPALASPGIPGGDAMGMENLSTEQLRKIANSKTVSPFRRRMAQRLLRVRSQGGTKPPSLTVSEWDNLAASIGQL